MCHKMANAPVSIGLENYLVNVILCDLPSGLSVAIYSYQMHKLAQVYIYVLYGEENYVLFCA